MDENKKSAQKPFDVLILGGGVAALSAAIYTGRKMLNTCVLASEVGGQTALQPELDNWAGFLDHDGFGLVQQIKKQLEVLSSVTIREFVHVVSVRKTKDGIFVVTTKEGDEFFGKTVLIATGVTPRLLNVPGEKEFEHKGVTYCATCDAPLFGGKDVAVVGGGNAGLEAALQLTSYANKVYLLHIYDKLMGDEVTIEKVLANKKITVLYHAKTKMIKGDVSVTGLTYDDAGGKEQHLSVQGVFVNIGRIPNSDFVSDILKLNKNKEIIVDGKTNETSEPGIFAAGDVTDVLEKQSIIAAGAGAQAALSLYRYLTHQK